jgi:hypothetical protein
MRSSGCLRMRQFLAAAQRHARETAHPYASHNGLAFSQSKAVTFDWVGIAALGPVSAGVGALLSRWMRPDLDGHLAVLQTGALPIELRTHRRAFKG